MSAPPRAWLRGLLCALAGIVLGCSTPVRVQLSPDDQLLDRVWLELSRGDVAAADLAAEQIEDPEFRARAVADVDVARRGRSAVLSEWIAEPNWLAARFLSSRRRARARLREARAVEGAHAALMLEDARRSGTIDRREALARGALTYSPGGAEALAMLVETLLAQRQYAEAEECMEGAPETARLRLARRRLQAYTGRLVEAGDGLIQDIGSGAAVPASVILLQKILEAVPQQALEQRAFRVLESEASFAPEDLLQHSAESWLQARLAARLGLLDEAMLLAEDLPAARFNHAGESPLTSDGRLVDRWNQRRGGRSERVREPLEAQVDRAAVRTESAALLSLRLAHEWGLAARGSYARATETGSKASLDQFLEGLDAAAEPLGTPLRLQDVERVDYGLFGEMLDTQALQGHLPGAFVTGGKGLGMPPELTWYDLVSSKQRELPAPPGGSYEEYLVTNLRVPGYAASRGARFAGAGLDRFVFLDLDQVAQEGRFTRAASSERLEAWPAAGVQQRRDLSEPLETAWQLTRAAQADAGDRYEELALEALSIHERRHIIDVREFFGKGAWGQFSEVLSAGLFPGAVRAEVERRAQLDALREATEPRIPLAHIISYLPVEGASTESEHARGYEQIMEEFLAVLDEERWEGALPLEDYGVQRDRVLLQQLDKLPPDVIRSIARSVEM
ncbi:MAG: tetratricopeptide repeat protein [Planctomycetota bacterium]|nr:tetratricopeptide repeat protein [Planctomycetota bacterium]